MNPVGIVAVVAAVIGPIQSVGGWLLAGSLWDGYDPIRQTISDLAAPESPVATVMSAFFILGGTLTIVAGLAVRPFALPGRIALVLAGLATYGLTIFPTPLIGYSIPHRIFAITSFVLCAGWPLLAMRFRKDAPRIIRPTASILATAAQTVLAVWFLMTWTEPDQTAVGLWERVVVTQQAVYLSLVVLVLYAHQRRDLTLRG
ncbi:MAG: hypothetical protein RLZZ587_480 [Actinomycetota bacterium]|jgi:hypothetical membrane protein